MRNVSDKIWRGNQNALFVFSPFFPPENRAVYEIMWKNIVQPDRQQMTIWRMRIAWWIPKATNTHTHTNSRLCNTYGFSHCNSGYANAPQCYVIRTLPNLLNEVLGNLYLSFRASQVYNI